MAIFHFKTIHQILISGKAMLAKTAICVTKRMTFPICFSMYQCINGKKCMERCQQYSSMLTKIRAHYIISQ